MKPLLLSLTLYAAMLMPDLAAAYVGPGLGLSALGSVLSFLGIVIMLVAGFVWYPAKRLLRALRARRAQREAEGALEMTHDARGP